MKCYAVGEMQILDPRWIAEYVQNVTKLVVQHGGRYLTRTSTIEKLEGQRAAPQLLVIIEWPSKEAALSFYHSEDYRPYREKRIAGSKSDFFLVPAEDVAGVAMI